MPNKPIPCDKNYCSTFINTHYTSKDVISLAVEYDEYGRDNPSSKLEILSTGSIKQSKTVTIKFKKGKKHLSMNEI